CRSRRGVVRWRKNLFARISGRRSSTPRPRADSKSSRGGRAPARVLRLPPFATRITSRGARRVIGLAPTNSVAEDLKADGFTRASTVHAELFRLKNGRAAWDKNTVVIVDEAAMLDTRVTRELLLEARRGGARLILAGYDRQLAS